MTVRFEHRLCSLALLSLLAGGCAHPAGSATPPRYAAPPPPRARGAPRAAPGGARADPPRERGRAVGHPAFAALARSPGAHRAVRGRRRGAGGRRGASGRGGSRAGADLGPARPAAPREGRPRRGTAVLGTRPPRGASLRRRLPGTGLDEPRSGPDLLPHRRGLRVLLRRPRAGRGRPRAGRGRGLRLRPVSAGRRCSAPERASSDALARRARGRGVSRRSAAAGTCTRRRRSPAVRPPAGGASPSRPASRRKPPRARRR